MGLNPILVEYALASLQKIAEETKEADRMRPGGPIGGTPPRKRGSKPKVPTVSEALNAGAAKRRAKIHEPTAHTPTAHTPTAHTPPVHEPPVHEPPVSAPKPVAAPGWMANHPYTTAGVGGAGGLGLLGLGTYGVSQLGQAPEGAAPEAAVLPAAALPAAAPEHGLNPQLLKAAQARVRQKQAQALPPNLYTPPTQGLPGQMPGQPLPPRNTNLPGPPLVQPKPMQPPQQQRK